MSRPLVAVSLAVLLVAAACSPASSPSQAAPTPTPGAASLAPGACETAPDPGAVDGWGPPAQAPTIVPIIVNSQVGCGENRFMFSFLDATNRPIATPDRSARVDIFDLAADGATPVASTPGVFLWAIEGTRGVYVATVTFARAGVYGAEFTTAVGDGPDERVRMTFSVVAQPYGLRIGDPAPASDTPTAADVGGDLARLSTDQHPDARFYEVSVGDAVAAGEPFVLVFATPKFCTSSQCGPTLDVVKPFIDAHPGVRFINVEPYKLEFRDGALQADLDAAGQLRAVPSVDEWRLLTEPVVFVVDRDGRIAGIFEGIIGTDELAVTIATVE